MPGNRLTVLLLLLGAGLAAVVAAELRFGVVDRSPVRPLATTVPVAPQAQDGAVRESVPALAVLTETVDRPLFSVDRRPQEAPAEEVTQTAPAPADPSAPDLVVSAIIIEEGQKLALLKSPGTDKTLRGREGDSVQGWTLSEIRPDGVTLKRGAESHEVALRTFQPPAPPPRPQAAQRVAPRTAQGTQRAQPRPRPRRPLRGPRRRSVQRNRTQ